MEICRWSRQPNANVFMDWVWDVVEKYRYNQFQQFDSSELANTISQMAKTLAVLTKSVLTMKQEMDTHKESKSENCPLLTQKKWSYWSTKMFPKYQLLADYFGISYRELYKNLYREFQNTYTGIDLNQYISDYCYEHKLDSVYTFEVIERNLTLRNMFEVMVDSLLEKYGLLDGNEIQVKQPTIFNMVQ